MAASFSNFYGTTWVGFCLNIRKRFFLEFSFSTQEMLACFYVTISQSFKRFQYLNFQANFLKNGNLFQKIGVPFFSWNH